MSAWESVGSSYVEAATAALPLHRLVLFSCGFAGALAVRSQTHLSVLETIARSNLTALTSFEKGLLASATVGDVLIGIAAVLIGWLASRASVYVLFSLAARGTDLWRRAQAAAGHSSNTTTATDRQAAIDVINKSLDEPRSRLRVLNAFAELCLGLGIGLLVATCWGNVLDAAVGILLLLLGALLTFAAVRLFLAEYFGPAMVMARLQGRPAPTPLNAQ